VKTTFLSSINIAVAATSMFATAAIAQCVSADQFRDGFEDNAPPTLSALPGLSAPPNVSLNVPVTAPLTLTAAFAPTIQAVQDGPWQNSATWGGRLPNSSDIVQIPRARNVSLAGDIPVLQGLHIDGALQNASANFTLRAKWILVSGRFQIGQENAAFTGSGLIELHGTDSTQNVMEMGTKNIAVSNGGVLKLHGECRLAWSKLASDALVGATQLQLADSASSWRVGDRILLVSSSYDPRQAETVTITAINGNTVSFLPALQYRHVGLVQSYDGKTLDQRAAVALLSRNLRIAGASDSDASAFGGHVMGMAGAHMQVSGVEFIKMGQLGRFGRYPIHWHKAGDRSGNYLIGTSIHDSFQRAAVLHSTHNVWLDSNVAYNIVNHAFVWAEDGDEYGNRLTRNIGALVRSPEPANFAFPINNPFHGNTSQDEHRSSVFWGRSYDRMTITGNTSAGVLDGFGFFFDTFSPAPFGDDEGTGLVFKDNIAHSTYKTLATGNQINYPEATTGHALMISTGSSGTHDHVFENYTGYYNVSGAWVEDRRMTLKNAMLADNGVGMLLLRGQVDGITVVGDSANTMPLEPVTPSVSTPLTAAIQIAGSNHGGKRAPVIRNTTIINQTGVGILYDIDNISPASEFSNLRFINTPERFFVHDVIHFEFPDPPSYGFTDVDGSLFGTGVANRGLRFDSPVIDSSCQEVTNSNTYRCNRSNTILLDADVDMNLADSAGRLIFARGFNYSDDGMPAQGAVSFVAHNGVYDVQTEARTSYQYKLEDALGKSVEFIFAAGAMPSLIQANQQNIAAAANLAALRSGTLSGFYFDAAQNNLHVRMVGNSGRVALRINANFIERMLRGRAGEALPNGAVDGFRYQVHANSASYRLRQPVLNTTPSRSGTSNASMLNDVSSLPILNNSANGDLVSISGYVFAPADGVYRIGLWGEGGGTAVWFGNTWVMGEPWAFINSNWLNNNQLTTEVVPFQVNGQVALRAGWHPITVVHAKIPENNQWRVLYLRWATPSNPDVWAYPTIKRATP
jgi:hypothetical protein